MKKINKNKIKLFAFLLTTVICSNLSAQAVVASPSFSTKSASSSQEVVKISAYSRQLINRTEYSFVLKSNSVANEGNSSDNPVAKILPDAKVFSFKVLQFLKKGDTNSLLKLTDTNTLTQIGKSKIKQSYVEAIKYFKDYKSSNLDDCSAVPLIDNSYILICSYVNSVGESKMFGMILSKTNSDYKINSINPGETSVVVGFPPDQNKKPIIVANPASGFQRKDLQEINGSILVPSGWYFRHESKDGTEAYFISKEEIVGDDGVFETGFSMNVVKSQTFQGLGINGFMDLFISKYAKTGKVDSKNSGEINGLKYKEITGTFTDSSFKFKSTVRVIANPKTNNLYMIVFESTPEKWNAEWNTHGKGIINYFSLDQSY